jgi:4-amino-4-deoxy-L-arabinose transferase-like glycosyltransferase
MPIIKGKIKNYKEKLFSEINKHPLVYKVLGLVLFLGLFVRVYRTTDLLGFYFDQGRDALVIWNLWHNKEPFLIGPVTGLAGIFLGPLYYYLIAPFYLFGGGHPAYPAIFLAVLSVIANLIIYYLGKEIVDRKTGLIAATIASFSYYIVLAGRWLSNPTVILLTSSLLFLSMLKVVQRKNEKWWIGISLLIGMSLQFEAASAVFYLPMIAAFAYWQRKKLPKSGVLFVSVAIFLLTLVPQVAFNFRHDGILFENFKKIIFEEKSFRLPFVEVVTERVDYFWTVFYSKIYPGLPVYAAIFGLLVLIELINKRKVLKEYVLPLFLIFLGVPVIGITLFQGNQGNIYDYYMTGYYLPMILFFSVGIGLLLKEKLGKIVVGLFLISFLIVNGQLVVEYLTDKVDEPTHITLGNELQAVNWIINDSRAKKEFNVDVYVPPVIPHSYDYLFLWQGTKRCGASLCGLVERQVDTLYTLYEVDPPHPWRLETWQERQARIGKVEEETSFGGITVQRRQRIKHEN